MDISNKTLALFLVGAIILSLGGTIISLNKISQITGPTGFATTGTGKVNLTILSATDISLQNASIDFGTGVVNASVCSFAILSNNNSGQNLLNCWVNDTYSAARPNNVPVTAQGAYIQIQNDGNVNITVTLTSTKKNATNFIGNCTSEDHNWYRFSSQINASETAPYTCPGSNAASSGWTNVTGASQTLCSELAWEDASDAMRLVFNISICKSNSDVGHRDDNLTITSIAA
jgi:hypothetical protein